MQKFMLFIVAAAILSCSQENDENQNPEILGSESVSNHQDLEEKKLAIVANEEEMSVANSLDFRHNDGSFEQVFAFLDAQGEIVKIEEKFANGKTGNTGVRYFYLENGKKFISHERFGDNENGKGSYRERISYYDKNGKVLSTKERLAPFEEDLEKEAYKNTNNYDCSMLRAEQVLNNEGVFATTFQGFLDNGNLTYLLVGGPGESGFASAVAVQYADKTIQTLKQNEKSFINQPLSINFEKMIDEKNLEFQVLISVKLL